MGGGISAFAHGCENCQVTTSILHSTIRDNNATVAGGVGNGEISTSGDSSATLLIDNSTISGNTTSGTAWYMGNAGGVGSSGMTTIRNSTISGNKALGTVNPANGKGGGIVMSSNLNGQGVLTMHNTTIANNEAVTGGGGIYGSPVGGLVPELTFINTIVANNAAPSGVSCLIEGGIFMSLGYNLEDSNTCNFNQPNDLVNTDPMLGPLQDNGGETWTHALLPGSLAIDQIPTGVNGCGTTLITDQRGIPRPQGATCDIGSFEKEFEPVPLTGVTIEGPTTGDAAVSYTFTATVMPISATLPISYVWQAEGQVLVTHTGGISDSASFAWGDPGVYDLQVAATNLSGTVTNTHTITISEVPITGLLATNDSPTSLGSPTMFTATISAGTNVSYTWNFGDNSFGIGENVTHTYALTGAYTATVTASNSASSATATTIVTIVEPQFMIYLPVAIKP